ncbi:MAG TPA: flagellar protein FlaG [Treponemataceae bacterium]|nr:flagellar protein FlaG [Treponemataceae bacterium]
MNLNVTAMGKNLAMDGRAVFGTAQKPKKNTSAINGTTSQAINRTQKNIERTKKDVQQLQEISNLIGRKITFSVDERLNDVIIKVVDPNTNKVIKEIPSEEIQNLKIHIKETFGFLVDELR